MKRELVKPAVRTGILPDTVLSAAVRQIQAVLLDGLQGRVHQGQPDRGQAREGGAPARRQRRASPAAHVGEDPHHAAH